MSTQIAQLDPIALQGAPALRGAPALQGTPALDGAIQRAATDDTLHHEPPLGIARGIASAVLIAVPFWALFAFAIYLMI